jgi:hypothetical protein
MTRAADVENPNPQMASRSQSNWNVWVTAQFECRLNFSRFGRLEVVPERSIGINNTFLLSKELLGFVRGSGGVNLFLTV